MSATNWYDNMDGLVESLRQNGLDGLRQICAYRYAARKKGEELDRWIIRRHFVLESDGQLWKIHDVVVPEGRRVLEHHERGSDGDIAMRQRQRLVMTFLEADGLSWSCSPTSIPSTACDRCHGTWTLDNIHEAQGVYLHREPDAGTQFVWRHDACNRLEQIQRGIKELEEIIAPTSFASCPMRLIPNQYWLDASPVGYPVDPWCILETAFGEIKIGWRKRVIVVDWSRAPGLLHITGDQIVAKPETTHGPAMVHCWSAEKASDALKLLQQRAELGGSR